MVNWRGTVRRTLLYLMMFITERGNQMQGRYQPCMTKPFCSTKSYRFQAANEINLSVYVCFIKLCPADALEDWYINRGGALTATAIVASPS